uniref:Pre-mRNA polyadenylation factor Fip1 domain-containing protein n=1 Tax=Chenopodium quinoa TaxID=63459 RepID=A0A803N2C9_CHEQI
MKDFGDDFGELYADIEVHTSSAINGVSDFYQLHKNQQQQEHCNEKKGGGDGRNCHEEAEDGTEAEFVAGVSEKNLPGKKTMRVDVDGTEPSGGDCGGERGNVGKNGCNSQHMYLRRYGSVFAGNQRAISSWKLNREDAWCGQNTMSGFVHGFSGNGNNFWLPWYRTIVDVDIDTLEEKSWTRPGADITDYFNFGFDEESWRNFCHSLDQLRHQTTSQTRNKVNNSFKLKAEAGATKELESEGFVEAESSLNGLRKITSHESDFATKQFKKQIGQAIHVEDSNVERQPSTDGRRPRNRDSDVVIQITVQDPEEPSSSGLEEPDNTLGTQCKMSEKGFGVGQVELKAEKSGGSNAYEMLKNSEEKFRSLSVSSDCKRSHESAAVSSQKLQDSHGENPRVMKILNSSVEDVDNGSNTTEANPCVADIDLSYDNHGCTSPSPSPSNSNTWSEALKDDYCDSRRNRDPRRSPSDSKKERNQVAKADYCHLRNRRDDKKLNESGGRYRVRVRNFIKEDLKHNERRVRRHLKWKSHSSEDNNYLIDTAEHSYGVHHSSIHHHRSEEWCLTSASDDEYWPSYRDNKSSFGCYDRRSVENRFRAKRKMDFDQQDHWGSRDEVDLNFQREWDEEQYFSDRRMQRMRGVTVQKNDWHLQERECLIREEKPFFRNQEHSTLRFSSSYDTNWPKQQREYDNVHFDKRRKHGRPFQFRNSNGSEHNKYARSNPLDDWQNNYLDLENRHERRLWYSGVEVGASGRENECLESPFDEDYPRYTLDDVDECWNRQTPTSAHDYHEWFPTHGERKHQNTLYRDDMDDPQLYTRHERHSRSISAKKGTGSRQVYDDRDAYNRYDAANYLDEDDYFEDYEERRNTFRSKGSSWAEDKLLDGCSDNDFSIENMLDSFNGIPRCNWHGTKHRVGPGRTTMHTQTMKNRFGVASGGGSKSYFKSSTRYVREGIGLWARNSVEVQNTVREKKLLGKFSNAGSLPNDDACKQSDKRFQKQFKRQQKPVEVFPHKKMVNKGLNSEALRDKLPIMNHKNATDLEEDQIPAEPEAEFLKVKNGPGPVYLTQKVPMKEKPFRNQKPVSQNGACVYDENRILETKAKMEKRMERFKEPVSVKTDTDPDPKPEGDRLAETAESKGQRPARKRKWGGS